MPHKVAIICDPGIDGAFAVALALHDPRLEVLALLATPGNVSAEQATKNIHVLVEQLDPPRWPRLAAAPPEVFDLDGGKLHGPQGLGGASFPCATLHNLPMSDKLLVELVRSNPSELTVVCLGPLTVVSRAIDLFGELPNLVKRFVCMGGSLHEPGNAGPVSEFHFACDPAAASKVVRSGAPITLIPLDVMRRVLFSPSDLLGLPSDGSPACRFLRQIVPHGISATSNLYGIEGFHLKDVLGVAAVALPESITTKPMAVDVETRGQLTRGMSVFDERTWERPVPNVDVAIEVDSQVIRKYINAVLRIGPETAE